MSRSQLGIGRWAALVGMASMIASGALSGGCKQTAEPKQDSTSAPASSSTASPQVVPDQAPAYRLAELDHAAVGRLVASVKWQTTQTKRSKNQKYRPGEDWTSQVSIYDRKGSQAQVSVRCYADPSDLDRPTTGSQAYFDQKPCRLNVSVMRVAGDAEPVASVAHTLLRKLLAAPNPAK